MGFRNVQIDSEELPRAADLALQSMAPAYPREVLVQHAIIWFIIALFTTIPHLIVVKPLALKSSLIFVPLLFLFLGTLFTWLAVAQARVKAMALRDHDIALRTGLFWRKTIMLAFSRVQHSEVSVGPLQRRFGLASLKLFTAGGSSVDLQIDGLTQDKATELREFIMARSTAVEPS